MSSDISEDKGTNGAELCVRKHFLRFQTTLTYTVNFLIAKNLHDIIVRLSKIFVKFLRLVCMQHRNLSIGILWYAVNGCIVYLPMPIETMIYIHISGVNVLLAIFGNLSSKTLAFFLKTNVMIIIFCDFCQFSQKILVFFVKTNVSFLPKQR